MKPLLIVFVLIAAIISAAYGALVYYDNNFRYGRMWETQGIRPHEEPILIMHEDVIPVGGGELMFRASRGKGLTSPLDDQDPQTLAMGKKAYFTYCVHCHGKYHDGKGTVGQSFNPIPIDLRSSQVLSQSDGMLFYTISFGKNRSPALATTVPFEERWAIIHYLRSLPAISHDNS